MGLSRCRSFPAVRQVSPLRHRSGLPAAVRFRDAAEAWLWTVGALAARRDGGARGNLQAARPCDPDDIVRCLDRLYRERRIVLAHARVLRVWGERQIAPDSHFEGETCDLRLWTEAMTELEPLLRAKSIVNPHYITI